MEALATTSAVYYTGYDSVPAAVIGKTDCAVPFKALIASADSYNSAVDFSSDDTVNVGSIDGYGRDYTYSYLYGSPRCYYPNLASGSSAGAVEMDAYLAITGYQARFSELSDNDINGETLDLLYSYRLVFGQNGTEFNNGIPSGGAIMTVGNLAKYVTSLTFILPEQTGNTGGSGGGGGSAVPAATEPTADGA